jgi:pimeloyl-ACP methyl ester carboxylesterase
VVHGHATLQALAGSRTASAVHGPGKRARSAGVRDATVPPVNAKFLYQHLPASKLDLLEAGHFTWEDAADEYAALVTSWVARGL